MRKTVITFLLAVICLSSAILSQPQIASADFTPNHIIDDGIFDNANTMTAAQIDAFLNQFPNSCISTNSGFQAVDPVGYSPSSGYKYGEYVSAGSVVYDSAQAYGINPQVLLATLQKEQSLVAGGTNFCSNGDENKYAAAVGYGCPDSVNSYSYSGISLYKRNGQIVSSVDVTCVNSSTKAGFSQQVIRAAWLFKFGEERSKGNIKWAVIKPSWDNSDDLQSCYSGPMTQGNFQVCPNGPTTYYDGFRTIDGNSVHMDNGATATLYWYTPHTHGNQLFSNNFINWFGSLYAAPYAAVYSYQTAYPTLYPEQTTNITFTYQNLGSSFWKDSLTTFPGAPPVRIATTSPINRTSQFYDSSWTTNNRPTGTLAAVLNSDGTTANDQHTVFPGQYGKYTFKIHVPNTLAPGTYREYFQVVAEGSDNWDAGGTVYQDITVKPVAQATYLNESAYPTLGQGDTQSIFFKYQNSGNTIWKDDTSIGSGEYPVHLATSNQINRISPFYDSSWLSINRPNSFTTVYESDGTTLAQNQHQVLPGQTATFTIKITAGTDATPQKYREFFQPVLEGAPAWQMGGQVFEDVSVTSTTIAAQYSQQSAYPTINRGSSSQIYLQLKNTGTANWDDDSSRTGFISPLHIAASQPINRVSAFFDSSWLSNNRPVGVLSSVYNSDGSLASSQHVVRPGQFGRYSFTLTAPSSTSPGIYNEYFQLIAEGSKNWDLGGSTTLWLQVTVN